MEIENSEEPATKQSASDELLVKGRTNRFHGVFLDPIDPDGSYDAIQAMVERAERIEQEKTSDSALPQGGRNQRHGREHG